MTHGLLSLPKELRLEVYEHALSDTYYRIPSTPPSFSIAWLRTCRHIYLEAASLVLPTIKFSFGTTEHLIFFLSSLSPEKVKQIRHITVHGTPFGLYLDYPWFGSYMTHTFCSALECFPGLQLATLTVRDCFHDNHYLEEPWGDIATYYDIQNLIKVGKGWRELRYVSCSTAILNWRPFQEWHEPRLPQPTTWDNLIKKRDGAQGGAGVEIWFGPVQQRPSSSSANSSGGLPSDQRESSTIVQEVDAEDAIEVEEAVGGTGQDPAASENGGRSRQSLQPDSNEQDSRVGADEEPEQEEEEEGEEEDDDGEEEDDNDDEESTIDPSTISWEGVEENEPWLLTSADSFSQLGPQGGRMQAQEPSSSTVSSSDGQGNVILWSIRDDQDLKTEQRTVVIIAKRGKDADIVADGQNMETKMKTLLEKFNGDWKEMRRKGVLLSGHHDPWAML